MKSASKSHLATCAALLFASAAASAHIHFAAGISDANGNGKADAGEPLAFVGENGENHIFHLLPRPAGFRPSQRCGGYYMLDESARALFPEDSFSMIALSDGQFEFKAPFHAATGAWIWCEITKVQGPAGGHFGFWDQEQSFFEDVPSVSMAANEPTGNPRFVLSEGADASGEDPGGHIHERSWTADKPGDYRVSFRLIDLSTNGPGGGPWHVPSVEYTYLFRAGPDFQPALVRAGKGVKLTWPSQMGIYPPLQQTGVVFTVYRSTAVDGFDWRSIGSVTGTTNQTISFTDTDPPAGRAFYKLAYDWADR